MTSSPPPEDPRLAGARLFAQIFDLYWPRFLQVAAFGGLCASLAVPTLRDPGFYLALLSFAAGGTGGQILRRKGRPS